MTSWEESTLKERKTLCFCILAHQTLVWFGLFWFVSLYPNFLRSHFRPTAFSDLHLKRKGHFGGSFELLTWTPPKGVWAAWHWDLRWQSIFWCGDRVWNLDLENVMKKKSRSMLLWSLSSEVCTGWAGWHSSRFLGDERDLRVIFALGFPNHDQKIISPLRFQTSGPTYSTQSWERWGRKWNEVKACSACRDPMIIMDPPDASFLRRTCAFCLRRRWGNGMGNFGRRFSELATQNAAILHLKDVLIFLNFLLCLVREMNVWFLLQAWFRNTWSWNHSKRPSMTYVADERRIEIVSHLSCLMYFYVVFALNGQRYLILCKVYSDPCFRCDFVMLHAHFGWVTRWGVHWLGARHEKLGTYNLYVEENTEAAWPWTLSLLRPGQYQVIQNILNIKW